MLQDADRLQHTVEQVLRAGVARQRRKLEQRHPVDLGWLVQECVDTARTRHHLADDAITLVGDGSADAAGRQRRRRRSAHRDRATCSTTP